MAKTGAERQREYRLRSNERNNHDGDMRLNTWLRSQAVFALRRLSKSYGVTQREVLERLIIEADATILKTLAPDSPELDSYFDVTR